jgi:hypothetical protein
MITRRYLEKESTVLGLPMTHVGLLVGMMVGMILLSTVAKLLLDSARWFNHLTVVLALGSYLLLRFAASQKHPTYLSSNFSYRLLQRGKYYEPVASPTIRNRQKVHKSSP